MKYEIASLNMGKPSTYLFGDKEVHTGIIKTPTNEPCVLKYDGFTLDGQADLKNHGGKEKALLLYSANHYPYWENTYHQTFTYPSFGENITIDTLTEKDVYIGDVFQLGTAIIQVSQPRQPCYKIAAYQQLKDLPARVTLTGFSGVYFRVLQEGVVSNTDVLEKIEEAKHKITSYDIFNCLFHDKANIERMKVYIHIDSLSENVKRTFQKRIMKQS